MVQGGTLSRRHPSAAASPSLAASPGRKSDLNEARDFSVGFGLAGGIRSLWQQGVESSWPQQLGEDAELPPRHHRGTWGPCCGQESPAGSEPPSVPLFDALPPMSCCWGIGQAPWVLAGSL